MTPSKEDAQDPGKIPSSHSLPIEPARVVASNDLFQGLTEITINHNGESYRLRQTKSGKLILNK